MSSHFFVKQCLDREVSLVHWVCVYCLPIWEWVVVDNIILKVCRCLRNIKLLDLSEVFHKGSLWVRNVKYKTLLLVVVARIKKGSCYLDLSCYILKVILNFRIILAVWPLLIKFFVVDFIHTLAWIDHKIELTHNFNALLAHIALKTKLWCIWTQETLINCLAILLLLRVVDTAVNCFVECVVRLLTATIVVCLNENSPNVLVYRSENIWLVWSDVCEYLHSIRFYFEKVSLLIVDESRLGSRTGVLLFEDVLHESDGEVVCQYHCA